MIIPPPTATPYDTVSFILDAARVRMNDEIKTLQPVSGQILKNNNEFTQQVCNNGWRKLQDFLGSLGMARFRGQAIVSGLPPVQTTDPGKFVYINWFNYFDGANLWTVPVLPADFAYPLWVAERQTGFNTTFGGHMESLLDGLPTCPKQTFNRCWEWRDDSIYMPGSSYVMDLQIRYGKFLPDFADAGQVQWFQGPVPIVHCSEALSNYWCAELAEARQDLGMDPKPFREKGEAAAKRLMNRDQALRQRVNIRRQSRSGRLEGCNSGYGGGWS